MEWMMNWWWVTVLGPIVLAIAIGYALLNRRRLTREEKVRQNRAVNRLYDEERGGSKPR